ncbi:MAG: hypothetical protein EOO17_01005 [Chloroflexi bacterium]|nr:MAG: hypothetical protein EOO17_01005 [Chloroflexota bacterium]
MYQLSQFAQTAVYNCSDSTDNTYGAGNFGTCAADVATAPGQNTGAETTAENSVGAPDTGTFLGLVTSGSFTIILPVAVALLITVAATIVVMRRKKINH